MATEAVKKPIAVRVDDRGRISLPASLRKALGVEPGDTLFAFKVGRHVRITKAQPAISLRVTRGVKKLAAEFGENLKEGQVLKDPVDILAVHAMKEYKAGQTRSLEDFAQAHNIPLHDEQL
jgi:AbrB family looped-hinge helix DNA binding protein